jgi:hypothetical protein
MRDLRLVIPVLFLASLSAYAHDADVVYARLESGPSGTLFEIVTLSNATLELLAPVDANDDGLVSQEDLDARAGALKAGFWNDVPLSAGRVACTRFDEAARAEDGFVTLTAHWRCLEGDLRQDFKVLRVLPTNYRVVLGSQLDGERGQRFAQGVFTALEVPRPKPPELFESTRFRKGIERGLQENGVVEALAMVLLIFLTAGTFRRAGLRLGALMLGALPVLGGRAMPSAAPVLMAICVVSVAFLREPLRLKSLTGNAAGLVGGLALSARAGILSVSEGAGWLVGLVVIAAGALVVGLPLGRVMGRRRAPFFALKLVLGASVLVTVGLSGG